MAVGFKVADAYINIHTEDDTRTGRQKVERDTSRWARGLGMKLGRMLGLSLLSGMGRAIVQALAMIAKLAALGLVAGAVASAVGGLAAAIVNLIPLIAELVNAAIAASGALLLIPAAIAVLITAVATAKLGLKGMGEAMKAVGSGDAKALNEALKKLAPQARAFVREIARLKPAFDRLRLRIQNTLFTGLARQIRDLGRIFLPILNDRLKEMAGVLNGAIRDALNFLMQNQTRIDLDDILNAAARAADNLRKGLTPILSIIRDVTAVASQLLADLTGGFGRTLEGWAADIARLRESGGLREIILDGLAALKALALLLGDIVGIIRGLVRAAGGAGGLFGFFDRLNRLINSLEGQAVLKELFEDLDRIGQALIPVLLAILKALMPVIDGIAQIAEAFDTGFTVLFLALGNALSLLVGPIKALEPLLFEIARGLAPVAVILGELVKAAAPGLTAFLAAFVNALIALVPVAPIVGKALGDLFMALAPILEAVGPALALALVAVAQALSGIAKAATPLIKLFSGAFASVIQKVLPPLVTFGAQVLPILADAGVKLAAAFAPLIPVMLELVQIWLDALLPHMPKLVEMFEAFMKIAVDLGIIFADSLLIAMQELVPLLPDLIAAVVDLSRAFHELFAALRPIFDAFMPVNEQAEEAERRNILIRLALLNLIVVLKIAAGIIGGIAAVIARFTGGVSRAKSGIESFGRAVMTQIGAAIGVFNALRGRIATAVGNLGNLLYDAGRRVIQGLINGIKSMLGPLGGALGAAAQFVKDHWPFSPAKVGPLSGRGDLKFAGQNIVQRLADGINSNLATARAAAAGLAGVFTGPMGPSAPGLAFAGAGAGGTGQGGPSMFGPYSMELDGKVLAEFVIDTVTGAPKLMAATAAEGDRQRSFISSARGRR